MSKGRGARDALEADGVGGVGDAVEITPARAGRKLEVGHAAGTRPEKMPCSLDGRAGRSSAAAADDTQPSRRSKMTRSAWDQNLIAFCPLAGWLRRLVLLVDLIRNRLAALIDPCRVNHKKTQGSPFPPSIKQLGGCRPHPGRAGAAARRAPLHPDSRGAGAIVYIEQRHGGGNRRSVV